VSIATIGPMPSSAVPGFLPSRNGLPFANAWPPGPTARIGPLDPRLVGIGDASQGLCGGMALTARDLFEAGIEPPRDPALPQNGSSRFRSIVRRQVQSLDWLRVPLRYYDLQAFRPDPSTRLSRVLGRAVPRVIAIHDEWPLIRSEIDSGRLAVIGTIRIASPNPMLLGFNHQVLGFAYDETPERIAIRIYDPNLPGRDDIELRAFIDPDETKNPQDRIVLARSDGDVLRGWFLQPYPPPGSLRAWR
jgi:hypothetical protein